MDDSIIRNYWRQLLSSELAFSLHINMHHKIDGKRKRPFCWKKSTLARTTQVARVQQPTSWFLLSAFPLVPNRFEFAEKSIFHSFRNVIGGERRSTEKPHDKSPSAKCHFLLSCTVHVAFQPRWKHTVKPTTADGSQSHHGRENLLNNLNEFSVCSWPRCGLACVVCVACRSSNRGGRARRRIHRLAGIVAISSIQRDGVAAKYRI